MSQIKTLSMKGKPVDFAYYMETNAEQPALGNALMNARGDQLDKQGRVVKTRAEMAQEYHRSSKSVKQVSIKTLDSETFQTPEQALADLKKREKNRAAAAEEKFGSNAASAPSASLTPAPAASGKRKISDAE